MNKYRTDLAEEVLSAQKASSIEGVDVSEQSRNGFRLYSVKVNSVTAEYLLGKPRGRYLTFSLRKDYKFDKSGFSDAVSILSDAISEFLPRQGDILVSGLGNTAITSDAVGPMTLQQIIVTRHLVNTLPERFREVRRVAAFSPGVLGVTGLEASDILSGIFSVFKPAALIVIDALAAESASRLLTTVQITDTGLVPGAGVGNARAALTPEKLGIPVIAIGVPTVIYTETLLRETSRDLASPFGDLIVTPKDIDTAVKDMAKLIGYALDLALFPGMTISDAAHFLA